MKKSKNSDNVRVCVRVRPLNKAEEAKAGTKDLCVAYSKTEENALTCTLKNSTSDQPEKHPFTFSEIFPQQSSQEALYASVGRPAVDDVMNGYNATIFVYGQTGSGKTHTMFGKGSAKALNKKSKSTRSSKHGASKKISGGVVVQGSPRSIAGEEEDDEEDDGGEEHELDRRPSSSLSASSPTTDMASVSGSVSTLETQSGQSLGIIPRAVEDIFLSITHAPTSTEFEVRLFFVEVYMEQVRDLLSPVPLEKQARLNIREDVATNSFYVEGCEMPFVTSAKEVLHLIYKGIKRRATSSTLMNETSSRSHCILNLTIKSSSSEMKESKIGKLFLVDLAGSEKVGKTKASGTRLEEAKLINKSLTTLGQVINSLTDGSPHVPYRDSILTKILKDSLGGNSKTSLVVCVSPSMYNCQETLSTLRFGARAKNIRNSAVVNKQLTVAELQSLLISAKAEIHRLEKKLAEGTESPTRRHKPDMDPSKVDELLVERAEEREKMDKLLAQVHDLQDELHSAAENNAALVEEREEQRLIINSLTEEILAWEDEYKTLKYCVQTRDNALNEAKCMQLSQAREICSLIRQIEEFIDPLTAARASVEDLLNMGASVRPGVTPQRRRTLIVLGESANKPLFPSRSRSNLQHPGGAPADPDVSVSQLSGVQEVLAVADRQVSVSLDRANSQSAIRPSQTAAAPISPSQQPREGSPELENGDAPSPPPLATEALAEEQAEMTLSAAAALRIAELEKNLEDLQSQFGDLRREYSQCKMDLQLVEKRLGYRQERIDGLKASLLRESQVCAELRQTLDNERDGQRSLLQMARSDASYWRQRFEELNNKNLQSGRSSFSMNVTDRRESIGGNDMGSLSFGSSGPGFNLFRNIIGGGGGASK